MKIDLVVVGVPIGNMSATIPDDVVNKVHVVRFDKNRGYNAALNEGFRRSDADIIGFCNNDLEFMPGSIETMVAYLRGGYDSVSPLCPVTHIKWWNRGLPRKNVVGYEVGSVIAGWCIFMKRSTWEEIGGFDERLIFWCCDNAYAEQIKAEKLKHALIVNAKVKHLKSHTLNKVRGKEYQRLTTDQIRVFNQLYNKKLFNL